jgi:hypothetical protein
MGRRKVGINHFEAHLTRLDTGEDFTEGRVKVLVRVGRDILREGLGEVWHVGEGLWEYLPDESEIGPFKTVVLFQADGALTGMDKYFGTVEEPITPPGWAEVKAISRSEFLEITVGLTPRKDCEFWLAQLLQADPIPLTGPIKKGLKRAYPQLFR